MRDRGGLLLRVTQALGLTRLRETVILPAVADMQHECFEAGSGARFGWAVARGYWSIVSGSAFYAVLVPARHVRENWAGLNAPGPRLLREAWPPAVVSLGLCLGIVLTSWPHETWRRGASATSLLLPGLVVMFTPLALAVGVGWALARDRSGSRAALALGMFAAAASFAVMDLAVPRANLAFRAAFYPESRGQIIAAPKGSREMTLRELGAATTLAEATACSCLNGESLARLRISWHDRLSIPALAVSFMMLATVLSRSGRRVVVLVGLGLAYGAALTFLRFGEAAGNQGYVPVVVAGWGAHLVPLTLAALLPAVMGSRAHALFGGVVSLSINRTRPARSAETPKP
jgi:hypothetical protein